MPRLPVVLGLAKGPERRRRHGMRKTRVFGQLMGVQGMVIGDVTMQPDPDGDGEVLVVSVRPDARSGGRCAQCRRSCPGCMTPASGPGGGGRWTLVPRAPSWSPRRRGCSARSTVCLLYTSDAADEEDSVDLGGRRIIKKKKTKK